MMEFLEHMLLLCIQRTMPILVHGLQLLLNIWPSIMRSTVSLLLSKNRTLFLDIYLREDISTRDLITTKGTNTITTIITIRMQLRPLGLWPCKRNNNRRSQILAQEHHAVHQATWGQQDWMVPVEAAMGMEVMGMVMAP
jgi:hypothetical protein